MTAGSVTFMLNDGEALVVPGEDVRPVYDLLWEFAPEPGAVSTAALLIDAWRRADEYGRGKIELNLVQSAVLRKVWARLNAAT